MIKRFCAINFNVTGPNVNNMIFNKESYFKCLDDAIARGLPFTTTENSAMRASHLVMADELIGTVKRYDYDEAKDILDVWVDVLRPDLLKGSELAYACTVANLHNRDGMYPIAKVCDFYSFTVGGNPYWTKGDRT